MFTLESRDSAHTPDVLPLPPPPFDWKSVLDSLIKSEYRLSRLELRSSSVDGSLCAFAGRYIFSAQTDSGLFNVRALKRLLKIEDGIAHVSDLGSTGSDPPTASIWIDVYDILNLIDSGRSVDETALEFICSEPPAQILSSEKESDSDFDLSTALSLFADTAVLVDSELESLAPLPIVQQPESEAVTAVQQPAPSKIDDQLSELVRIKSPRTSQVTLSLKRHMREQTPAPPEAKKPLMDPRIIVTAMFILFFSVVSIGGGVTRSRAGQAFATAVAEIKSGKYEQALKDLDFSIRIYPANVPAYFYRAELERVLNQPDKAILDYETYLKHIFVPSAKALRGCAWARIAVGDFSGAMKDCKKASRADRTSADPYCIHGIILNHEHHYKAAQRYLRQYLDLQGAKLAGDLAGDDDKSSSGKARDMESTLFSSLASYDQDENDPEDAAARVAPPGYHQRATQVMPKMSAPQSEEEKSLYCIPVDHQAEGYKAMAVALAHENKLDKAVAAYGYALAINPKDRQALLSRARCYVELQRYSRAIEDCTAVIHLDPMSADPYYLRAVCEHFLRLTDNAVADLTEAIKREDKPVEAYVQRARCYIDQNRYGKAIADCKKALNLDPSQPEAIEVQRLAAHLASRKATPGRALQPTAARSASSEKPTKARAYSLMCSGEYESAADMLDQVVRAKPEDVEARRYFAYTLACLGQASQAAEQYQIIDRAQQLAKEDMVMYGLMLAEMKQDREAVQVLKRCLERNPEFTNARVALIKEYQRIGLSHRAVSLAGEGLLRADTSPRDAAYYEEVIHRPAGATTHKSHNKSQHGPDDIAKGDNGV